MDISNTSTINQQVPVVKPDGKNGSQKLASSGNILPTLEKSVKQEEGKQKELSTKQPEPEELRELVDEANQNQQVRSSNLHFSVDEGSNRNVVRIEDSETGELIRQIPSEEMVALAEALSEQRQGMMLEERV